MRFILFSLILFFNINFVTAQNSKLSFFGKSMEIIDTSFRFTVAIQEVFYENNGSKLWVLRQEFRKLNFDHCNHSVQLLLYIDTIGNIKYHQLVEGSGLPFVDSIVTNRVLKLSGDLIPVNYNNKFIPSLIYLRFRYFSKINEDQLPLQYPKNGAGYFYQDVKFKNQKTVSINFDNTINIKNECEDDLYFYNEGLRYLNALKYSKAIYNFSEAIKANPDDNEALYNLGIAYQEEDNNKKACKCFSEGIEKGDPNAIKAFNKYCNENSKK